MKPFICFIHIGKNGGTTFNQILHDNLPRFFSIEPRKRTVEEFNKEYLKKFIRSTAAQGLGGHPIKPYLNYESVVKRPIFYITFLREPVKRYISLANFRQYSLKWSPDLENTLRHEMYQNHQVLHLTGKRRLEEGIDMIQRIDFVGIVEEYDTSLLLLKQQLKPYINLKINYEKQNVAKDRNTNFYSEDTISEDQLNRIKTENALDIQLYQRGLERFEQMKANYQGDLQADLAAFQESNKHYRRKKSNYYFHKAKNGLVKKIIQPIIVR